MRIARVLIALLWFQFLPVVSGLKSVDSYFLSEFPDFSSPTHSDLNKLSGYIKYNFSGVV